MKLRQKLAMVLAAAMVITAVPVTTMAKSTNELTKVKSLVEGSILKQGDKVFLNMAIEDKTTDSTTFFLKATDFEFDAKLYAQANPHYAPAKAALDNAVATNLVGTELNGKTVAAARNAEVKLDGKEVGSATVEVKFETTTRADEYETVTLTKAQVKEVAKAEVEAVEKILAEDSFTVDGDGGVTTTSSLRANTANTSITILSKSEIKVDVKDTVATNNMDVEIAIPIYGKVLKGNPAITVDSDDSVVTSGKYSLTGSEIVTDKNLTAKVGDVKNISVDGFGSIADITIEENVAGALAGKTVTLTLPNNSDLVFHNQYGKSNATVTAEGNRGLANQLTSVTAAYAVDSKGNVDEKKLELTMPSSLSGLARGSVTLKGIQVQSEDKKGDVKTGEVKVKVTSKDMADTTLVVANVSDYGVALTVDEVDELTAGLGTTKVKVKLKENAVDTLSAKRPVYFTIEEGRFVGLTAKTGFTMNADKDEITLDLTAKNDKGEAIFKTNEVNEFEFEVEIATNASNKGPVVINATSRSLEEDMKVEVAKVTPAVEVKADPIVVKAGLKDQVGGKIVITETAEEKLAKNKEIRIKAEDAKKWGLEIEDAKIEVTSGDIQIKHEITKAGEILITVNRTSSEASTITISDISVTADRTIPEGSFDFYIGGTAIADLNNEKYTEDGTTKYRDQYEDAITVADFIKVGTKNTEDITDAATAKSIVLTVGSTAYTVNGEAKTADAAAFIDGSNRTMVPVKFIAEEFGKIDFNSLNGVGTVTVFKDGSVLQFQNGSNIMNKNGINIPMDTKVVIKDGRTYVPFKYVADGLGINYSYDTATKSITFTNQAK